MNKKSKKLQTCMAPKCLNLSSIGFESEICILTLILGENKFMIYRLDNLQCRALATAVAGVQMESIDMVEAQ
jgi:hypothetical protein